MSVDFDFLITLYLKIFTASAPIPGVMMYVSIASFLTPQERWRVAQKGTAVATFILLCAVFCGSELLRLMGIDMNTFRVAGGLVLGKIGWDMLYPKGGASAASVSGKSLIVTPLAFPLIAGPGAVSSVIIGQSEAVTVPQKFYVYAAVLLIMLTFYIAFYIACSLSKYMKPAFIQICTKLFGILILAIGFKLMTFGVVGLLRSV